MLQATSFYAAVWPYLVSGNYFDSMLAVGLVAAWIPARHALAVDPMILLREE
jgi:ABC-type antimicrobial peptide transport system permease subunit